MASLSPSRIAAFEFLIQFRSAGRNQVRNAIKDMFSLGKSSASTARSTRDLSKSQILLAETLRRARVNALSSLSVQKRYTEAINAERRAQERLAFARAANSRPVGIIRGIVGRFTNQARANRVAGNAAQGFVRLRGAAAKLGPVIMGLSKAFSLLGAAIRSYVGLVFKFLKFNAVIVGATALAAVGLARLADSFTNLTNRIRVASDGTKSITQQTVELTNVAVKSRTAFNNIAELYGRISINAKSYGKSQQEVLKFTELTAKAVKVGGSTDREASQSLLQFSQGLGSNRLSGDELRAVREQTPFLADQIARGLGSTIGDLKKLGEEGKLTTDVIFEAIFKQEREINIAFGRVEATFSDSLTNIKTTIGVFFGSVLSNLKFGPRFFEFTNKISSEFQRISKFSNEFALAIRNIPILFRTLFGERDGLSQIFDILSKIGDFFVNLPQKILEAARAINIFAQNIQNGATREEAIARSGLSESTINKLTSINETFRGFVFQLNLLVSNLVLINAALGKITRGFTKTKDAVEGAFETIPAVRGIQAASLLFKGGDR
jgi:tape measure domain-containing protein